MRLEDLNIRERPGTVCGGSPVIKLYGAKKYGYVSRAAQLILGIAGGDRLRFVRDIDSGQVYVGRTDDPLGLRMMDRGQMAVGSIRPKLALPTKGDIYLAVNPEIVVQHRGDTLYGISLVEEP